MEFILKKTLSKPTSKPTWRVQKGLDYSANDEGGFVAEWLWKNLPLQILKVAYKQLGVLLATLEPPVKTVKPKFDPMFLYKSVNVDKSKKV